MGPATRLWFGVYALVFSIVYWLVDAAIDTLLLDGGRYIDLLLLHVPPHELYVRFFVAAGFFGFAAVASINRQRQSQLVKTLHESYLRLVSLFEDSPLPMWEDDWSAVAKAFRELRAQGITDLRAYFDARPDEVQRFIDKVRIVDVNRATLELHGVADKGALIEGLSRVFTRDAEQTFKEELIAIGNGETRFHAETVHQTVAGERQEIDLTVQVAPGHEENLDRVIVSTLSIADRKAAERALVEREEMYRDLFDNASDLIQSVAPDGRFLYVNPAWHEILEYSPDELDALDLFDIIHPNEHAHCRDLFDRVLRNEHLGPVETRFVSRTGRIVEVEGSVTCRMEGGRPISTRAVFRNVTERREYERRLDYMARHDSLTGVFNRHSMNEILDREEQRARRYNHPIGLLMIDVDRFKEINDRFGHQVGDKVLQAIGELLLKEVRSADYVIRYGGDEFLVVLPETNGETEAVRGRIERAVEHRNTTNELIDFPVTLSIGTAHLNVGDTSSIEDILRLADERMYRAKRGDDDFAS
ncbi:GGDEF domain-containing protein [Candidatus Bipolaricaulota bacterium]|nr:GGDEF domain-containing protein [Candidatus Bipolaricaulota bacterium]